jgi:DNA polymerase-3 subunit gamma/tau
MGQALYRKYRSKSLAEIVGQEHITSTLAEALKTGRISHAYLFTGPRGTGKTSIARILAHEINDLPYTDDSSHIDIIEIDAASNRRIDEIRDLRDKVYIAPAQAKYKVYIIDEVHMLTKEAFNALLKTLEEPPAHVVFVLATTEAHKLPETIISRTQRYTFKPVDPAKVVAHLAEIAQKEKIKITDEALQLIAAHGEGSFRDSISLLDQASNHADEVDAAAIQAMLGIAPAPAIEALLVSVASGKLAGVVAELAALEAQGIQAANIAKQLGEHIRQQLLEGRPQLSLSQSTDLLQKLIDVPSSHDPSRYLEIVLLGALPDEKVPIVQAAAVESSPPQLGGIKEELPTVPVVATQKAPTSKPEKLTSKGRQSAKSEAAMATQSSFRPLDTAVWSDVLGALKQKYNTLYGVVRMAQPQFNEKGQLELHFAFAFHQKRVSEAKNRQIIADALKTATGQDIEIICVFNKDVTPMPAAPKATAPSPKAPLETISNIFGGGELLQS